MKLKSFARWLLPMQVRRQLRRYYDETPIGRRRRNELAVNQNRRRQELESRDRELLRLQFQDRLVVRMGPFAGMKYVARSNGSAFLPKIAGSYEEPVHDWIKKVVSNSRYTRILDIGCAEGYYAVGFATRRPDISVYAYDIDADAREQTKLLASNNGVENVEVKGLCDAREISAFGGPSTLIFCDIEGGEVGLLDPAKIPILSHTDLIVETHDFLVPGVSEILLKRFASTHRVSLRQDYPSRVSDYNLSRATYIEKERILDERRPDGMCWIMAEALYNLNNSSNAHE